MDNKIEFKAILNAIRTDPGGGWKIVFEVPQNETTEVMKLSELRDMILELVINKN